ncbi:signal recognition particle receptor subunit alpha [bacterium]|nr:signal recognition particle receptor subunit alpha [bacterium]
MFNFFSNTFENLKNAVSKTAQTLVGNVVGSVEQEEEFSDFVLEDMEDLLISADLGVDYASELVDNLRNQSKIKPSEVKSYLKNSFV